MKEAHHLGDARDVCDTGRIQFITFALSALKLRNDPRFHDVYMSWIEPLASAAEDNRWDLIAAAAQRIGQASHPADSPERLKGQAKLVAALLAAEEGMRKADILHFMGEFFPKLRAAMPLSKKGLSIWWDEIGPNINQFRGSVKPMLRKDREKMVARVTEFLDLYNLEMDDLARGDSPIS